MVRSFLDGIGVSGIEFFRDCREELWLVGEAVSWPSIVRSGVTMLSLSEIMRCLFFGIALCDL